MAPMDMQSSDISPDSGRDELNSLSARIRVVEERLSDMRKRFKFLEENIISYHKKNLKDSKDQQQQSYELRKSMRALEGKIMIILKELQLTSTKQEVAILKKYLDLWNPLKFITDETLQKRLDEILRQNDNIDKK